MYVANDILFITKNWALSIVTITIYVDVKNEKVREHDDK